MAKYSFLYNKTEQNKDLWKAIKATELIKTRLTDTFYKVTLMEADEATLQRVVADNYNIIAEMMA